MSSRSPSQSSRAPSHVRILCSSCGKKLKFAVSAAGKKGKCPGCGTVFRIPHPRSARDTPHAASARAASAGTASAGAASAGGTGFDAEEDLLSQLAAGEAATSASAAPADLTPAPPPPPAGMVPPPPPAGAGGFAGPAGAAPAARSGVLSSVAKSTGRFALGCVLASIAAAFAAGVWVVVGIASKTEFGVLAWALGAVVGLGMAMGYRKASSAAGIIAAGMSLLAILVAKAFIFGFVVYALLSGDTKDTELRRAFVAYHMAVETLESRGVRRGSSEWQSQWKEAYTASVSEVKELDADAIEERWQYYRDQDALAAAEAEDLADAAGAPDDAPAQAGVMGDGPPDDPNAAEDAGLGGLLGAFFSTMFGPVDVIFLLLSLASAYRVGSRGMGASA